MAQARAYGAINKAKRDPSLLLPGKVMEIKSDISCLQENFTVTVPGSVDKKNYPIILVTIPADTLNLDIVPSLQYIADIFSQTTKSKGLCAILDARRGSWKVAKACVGQIKVVLEENVLRKLIVVKPDAFWDNKLVDNCTATYKYDNVIFIPRSRINKFVDQSQLPVELGGNLILDHKKWIENRQRVEEFYKDVEVTMKELEELHKNVTRTKILRSSQLEDAINFSFDMAESVKMLVHNATETGKELVQNIEYENRTRKFSLDDIDKVFTPQDTMDSIEKIHTLVNTIRQKQQEVEAVWSTIEKSRIEAKDLSHIKEIIAQVTNWILGPAENILNANQKIGFDVSSAEDLRKEHETIELQCWETYGVYAEILHKIELVTKSCENNNITPQVQDLLSQKEYMDFVCRSFAMRLEKRRNILIESLRFFRLVAEYFDKTGDVFEYLVMGSNAYDFNNAANMLKELQENQTYLDIIEQEIQKEGDKLSDMLSMPVKNALGKEITIDYSNDISNIRDILDATKARKNIFSDSVELQKITLKQVSLIDTYETDACQAVKWLRDILKVMLKDHAHVGCTVYEIQSQKEEHQIIQETAKDIYNYGCQLLTSSLLLRQSCKLPLDSHSVLSQTHKRYWEIILAISQEQMTRLRVSAVFYRSIEDHCNQLRDMREAVATLPLICPNKKKSRVNFYFSAREKLMVEVGRMVRLGRLLRSRLKDRLFQENGSFPSEIRTEFETEYQDLIEKSIENNDIAIEAISERLAEVTQLSEELDHALKSAQQDCIVFSTTSTSTNSSLFSEINNNITLASTALLKKTMADHPSTSEITNQTDEQKSEEEFQTASDTTLQHSRSSSYNTASECERYSPWWHHGKDDMKEHVAKEKMVLAVGCPDLPRVKEVLKPSPEVPPGKIVREVIETTHIKVQQQHTLGVKSFVLSSETVRNKNDSEDLIRSEIIRVKTDDSMVQNQDIKSDETDEDDLMKRLKEVGVLEQTDPAWSNYSKYTKNLL